MGRDATFARSSKFEEKLQFTLIIRLPARDTG